MRVSARIEDERASCARLDHAALLRRIAHDVTTLCSVRDDELFDMSNEYAEHARQMLVWLLFELRMGEKRIVAMTGVPPAWAKRAIRDWNMRMRVGDPRTRASLQRFFAIARHNGDLAFAARAADAMAGTKMEEAHE